MRSFRRFLGWVALLGLLAVVGMITFVEVRSRPKCVIAGKYEFVHFSSDGATLLTVSWDPQNAPHTGRIQVWDMTTGRTRFTFLDEADSLEWALARDKRLLAAYGGDGIIRIIDWRHGAEKFVRIGGPQSVRGLMFSSKGTWLYGRLPIERSLDFFVHVPTERVEFRKQAHFIDFNTDDRTVFLRDERDKEITVWDLEAGKKLGALAMTEGAWPGPSPDGRYYRIMKIINEEEERRLSQKEGGIADRECAIWDLATFSKRHSQLYRDEYYLPCEFSADSRHAWFMKPPRQDGSYDVEVIETGAGRRVLTFTTKSFYHDFSPDGTLFCVSDAPRHTAMIELASGRTLWKKPTSGAVRFVGATGVLLYQDDDRAAKPGELLDVHTGERRAVVPIHSRSPDPRADGIDHSLPKSTPNCLHLLAVGVQKRGRPPYFWEPWLERWWPAWFGDNVPAAVVMHTTTGRVLFRILQGVGRQHSLSDDGSTLATVEHETDSAIVIRVWDVHAQRAWIWAVVAMLGTWGGLWASRRGVGWLRSRSNKYQNRGVT